MVSVVIYSPDVQDGMMLKEMAKELIARISGDYWEIRQISAFGKLEEYISERPLIHLFIYDICGRRSLKFLLEIRKIYPYAHIMVVADTSLSPMEYIRPGLHVHSLLLRPWGKRQAYDVLKDFLHEYVECSEREKKGEDNFYVIETKEGIVNIPYDQIYFFEAREKKIYLCAGKEEFGFYSTMDKLAGELPGNFVRCHRGFIVNVNKIQRMMLSKNILYLYDGFDVPLSRSYKALLKGIGR